MEKIKHDLTGELSRGVLHESRSKRSVLEHIFWSSNVLIVMFHTLSRGNILLAVVPALHKEPQEWKSRNRKDRAITRTPINFRSERWKVGKTWRPAGRCKHVNVDGKNRCCFAGIRRFRIADQPLPGECRVSLLQAEEQKRFSAGLPKQSKWPNVIRAVLFYFITSFRTNIGKGQATISFLILITCRSHLESKTGCAFRVGGAYSYSLCQSKRK